MLKFEKRFFNFLTDHLEYCLLVFVFFAGLIIRISLREVMSLDMEGDFLIWYDSISKMSFKEALSTTVGNYSSLYQFVYFLLTRVPWLNPVTKIKMVSCFFDLLVSGYALIAVKKHGFSLMQAVTVFCILWICPVVFLNSAAWGQCDSIFSFFAVVSLVCLFDEKPIISFVFFGIAMMCKLQAIFFFPIYIFWYIKKQNYSFLHFFIIPLTMLVLYIPNLIAGRPLSALIGTYSSQVEIFDESIYINFSNLYAFFINDCGAVKLGGFQPLGGTFLAFSIALIIAVYMLKKRKADTFDNFLLSTVVLSYTFIMFLPKMHDRYDYAVQIAALILCVLNRKTIIPIVMTVIVSLFHYGLCLFQYTAMPVYLASMIRLVSYGFYLYIFFCTEERSLQQNKKPLKGDVKSNRG